jgi:nitrogen-specific signal transduction histidine kinase
VDLVDLAAVLDAIPKPVATISAALDVRYANAAFATLLGAGSSRDRAAVSAAIQRSATLCAALARASLRLLLSGEARTFRWSADDRPDDVYDVQLTRFGDDAVLLVADSVSEVVQAEDMYARTRSYFYGVLNGLNLGIIVLDEAFRVTFANEDQGRVLAALGLPAAPLELVGRPIAEAYPILNADDWGAAFQQVMTEGRPALQRRIAVGAPPHAAGTQSPHPVYCALTVLPLADGRGGTRGAVSITEDVTRVVRLEEELVRSERQAMVGQMAIALNHEINNPLTAILGSAEIALSDPKLDKSLIEPMQLVVEHAQRIAAVTRRLRAIEEHQLTEYGGKSGPMMLDLSGAAAPRA